MWTPIFLLAAAAAAVQASGLDFIQHGRERLQSASLGLIDEHIVGGQIATPHQFPWQAGLFIETVRGTRALCGGSLIHPEWILTAAHCLDRYKKIEVILGAHALRKEEDTQQRFISTTAIVHKGWKHTLLRNFANDIALIKLPQAAQINFYVQVVHLPPKTDRTDRFQGRKATMSGWGIASDYASSTAAELGFVESEVVSDRTCALYYLSPFMVWYGTTICTTGKGGKGTCNGDSGGPLVVYEDSGTPILVGVTSFGSGFGCAIGWPSAFTRTSKYVGWIEQQTGVKFQ